MKFVTLVFQVIALGLLCLIAYNTGVGKTLPVHHPNWMSCDSHLSRALFYSTLLKQYDMSEVAAKVKESGSIEEMDSLVVNGTNIDAPRTQWFESVSEPGKCQAQVFLRQPNTSGDNTAYIGFDVGGFAQSDRGFFGSLTGGQVLQEIHLDIAGTHWFKE